MNVTVCTKCEGNLSHGYQDISVMNTDVRLLLVLHLEFPHEVKIDHDLCDN